MWTRPLITSPAQLKRLLLNVDDQVDLAPNYAKSLWQSTLVHAAKTPKAFPGSTVNIAEQTVVRSRWHVVFNDDP